jgi:hypothetical protein
LTPEDWNTVIDALNDLHERVRGGLASFTGDGSTTAFQIAHGAGTTPVSAIVGKGAPNLPDIDYWTVDGTYITVYFKAAPASGAEVKIWWLALRPPRAP